MSAAGPRSPQGGVESGQKGEGRCPLACRLGCWALCFLTTLLGCLSHLRNSKTIEKLRGPNDHGMTNSETNTL